MTLSRTARFLILFLLLAAAAFVWVNFFLQDRAADNGIQISDAQQTPVQANVQPSDASVAPTRAATGSEAAAASATPVVEGSTAPLVADSAETTTGSSDAAVDGAPPTADASEQGTPTVVAPTAQAPVERDLVVAELPFLVTEPPAAAAESAGGDDGSDVLRPQAVRASINPFSPVLVEVPAAPATPIASAPPSSEPDIEVVAVEVPGAPALPQVAREPIVETVVAPTPRPLAPPSPIAQGLPRQLPSGTLPIAPNILQSARVVPIVEPPIVEPPIVETPIVETPEDPPAQPEVPVVVRPQPGDVAAAAAIREPDDALVANLEGAAVEASASAGGIPNLLGPAAIVVAEVPDEPATGTTPVATVPLAAGTDLLSRYLRDNSFSFTGSVLGPVSVGVFNSPLYAAPVVVSLGQVLPNTDIVLTDLRGQQAEFSLDDSTQVLTLDLRR